MPLHSAQLGTSVVTPRAGIGFVPGVDPFVHFQFTHVDKTFVAMLASEWRIPCVVFSVGLQIAQSGECHVTLVTEQVRSVINISPFSQLALSLNKIKLVHKEPHCTVTREGASKQILGGPDK